VLLEFLPELDINSPQGAVGRLPLDALRPTQNAVGMDEVDAKAVKLRAMSKDKREDYLLQRPVPVVIGNETGAGEPIEAPFFMLDHHHLAAALWYALHDARTSLFAEVRCNWLPLSGNRFWKAMARASWLYPFDGLGAGPMNPKLLKRSVMELENDLYRSLSWVVREGYGYVKDPANPTFAEFQWASFFRTRVLFDAQLECERDCMDLTLATLERDDPSDYADKVAYARYLASSPEAAGLPGFVGRPA
jgi:hypothetical protein